MSQYQWSFESQEYEIANLTEKEQRVHTSTV